MSRALQHALQGLGLDRLVMTVTRAGSFTLLLRVFAYVLSLQKAVTGLRLPRGHLRLDTLVRISSSIHLRL